MRIIKQLLVGLKQALADFCLLTQIYRSEKRKSSCYWYYSQFKETSCGVAWLRPKCSPASLFYFWVWAGWPLDSILLNKRLASFLTREMRIGHFLSFLSFPRRRNEESLISWTLRGPEGRLYRTIAGTKLVLARLYAKWLATRHRQLANITIFQKRMRKVLLCFVLRLAYLHFNENFPWL